MDIRIVSQLLSILIVGAVAFAVPAAAQAPQTQSPAQSPAQQKQPPAKKQPLNAQNVDPSLFDPQNQKECDYPSACGCNCNPAQPGAPAPNR